MKGEREGEKVECWILGCGPGLTGVCGFCSNLINDYLIGEAAGKEGEKKNRRGRKTKIQQMPKEKEKSREKQFQDNWCQTSSESLVSVWDISGSNLCMFCFTLFLFCIPISTFCWRSKPKKFGVQQQLHIQDLQRFMQSILGLRPISIFSIN